ncbi:MAG: hypothetical protein ACI9QD_001132 [Thermoproteota archaeon]
MATLVNGTPINSGTAIDIRGKVFGQCESMTEAPCSGSTVDWFELSVDVGIEDSLIGVYDSFIVFVISGNKTPP